MRLHIRPLDAQLLRLILPAAVLPHAGNVSFHTIDTFPEKRYGFVELPRAEADKLRNKFHGSILRGCKMRVEKARPEARTVSAADPQHTASKEEAETDKERKTKKNKKRTLLADPEAPSSRKRDAKVVEGIVLRNRQVKRGWTEPVDTKKKKKSKGDDAKESKKRKKEESKYTTGTECLLKTRLPANAVSNLPEEEVRELKKKKSGPREVVVHEFKNTTKFPDFLKQAQPPSSQKPATDFVEGRGWLDEDGNLVEPVKTRSRAGLSSAGDGKKLKTAGRGEEATTGEDEETDEETDETSEEEEDTTSSSGSSSSGSTLEAATATDRRSADSGPGRVPAIHDTAMQGEKQHIRHKPRPSSSSATSEATGSTSSTPCNSSSMRPLTITIPPPELAPVGAAVHPLEALYKRDGTQEATERPANGPPPQPFSFFDRAEAQSEEASQEETSAAPAAPMTPYSRKDLEQRQVRSAAPTPDTAHPSRAARMMPLARSDRPEPDAAPEPLPPTDFASWFWQNRSLLNRSWMSRRKTAAKEKRYRENKARASRAV